MVFPVVVYGCESWTTKKAEHWRIEAFELWYWRHLLRVPWTARRSKQSFLFSKGNQSWIFIGRTNIEAETPILCPPDAKSWLTGKDTDAGKDWKQEEKGVADNEMVREHHGLNRHNLSKFWKIVKDRGHQCAAGLGSHRAGHDLTAEQQGSNS